MCQTRWSFHFHRSNLSHSCVCHSLKRTKYKHFQNIFHISFKNQPTCNVRTIMKYCYRQLGPFTLCHWRFQLLFNCIFTPIISIPRPQSDIFFCDSVVSPTLHFRPLFTRGNVFIREDGGVVEEKGGREGACEGTEQDSQRKKRD